MSPSHRETAIRTVSDDVETPRFEDDSIGFAERERAHVRKRFVPHFEWVRFDAPSRRNLLPLALNQARVALVGTAGAHLAGEPGMSPRGELRVLPIDADVVLTHPGYDTERAGDDPEVVFPLQTLQTLADESFIGSVATTSISTMGFIPNGRRVINDLVPAVVAELKKEDVDLALFVPA